MKKLLYILAGCLAFAVGYGIVAKAYPSPGPFGLAEYHGYFRNVLDTEGTYVMEANYSGNAFPSTVNSASSFISFLQSQLTVDNHQKMGASFIIQTMRGTSKNFPPTTNEMNDWISKVNQYAAAGRVNWSTNFCFGLNTYYQGTGGGGTDPADDAFYDNSACATSIVFYNPDGTTYAIKRQCANPVGTPKGLAVLGQWTMSGHTTVDNATPYPGQTIHFSHYVKDDGPSGTNGQHIWYQSLDGVTNAPLIGGQDSGAYNVGQENLVNTSPVDVVVVPTNAAPGTQICQRIFFDHVAWNVAYGGYGDPVCATVQGQPSSCGGVTVTPPGAISPSDSYTVTGVVTMSGGLTAAQTINGLDNFYIKVTGPGVNFTNNDVTATAGTSGSNGTLTAAVTPGPTGNAGTYSITYGLTGPVSTVDCTGSFSVAYSPYLSIQGGDVAAGPGFGAACTPGTGSKILGNNLGSASGYYGAGTQLGAFALGNITNFATNTTLNTAAGTGGSTAGGSASQPSGLAFSNSGVSPTVWGTNFGKDPASDPADNPAWCVPDYVGTASGATPAPTVLSNTNYTLNQTGLNGLTSGKTYVVNGNLTTSGALQLGGAGQPSRITLVVNGNVLLNSATIGYASYSYVSGTSTVAAVPQFQLLVKGSIFVDKSVTQLAGFYAAQPSGGSGGNIYTCANTAAGKYLTGVSGDSSSDASYDASYYTDCNNRLTIYGSLSAKRVKWLRTNGNLTTSGSVNNQSAETVIYGPELWLGNLSGTNTGPQPYDAITGLPPIL